MQLFVDFTTHPLSGNFSPANVGAAWVEDPNEHWIFTLEFWGRPEALNLKHYIATGAPDYAIPAALGGPVIPPDVVTRATLLTHVAHHDVRYLRDDQGAEIPAGDYVLALDFVEGEPVAEHLDHIPFQKGPGPSNVSAPDVTGFSGVQLSIQ